MNDIHWEVEPRSTNLIPSNDKLPISPVAIPYVVNHVVVRSVLFLMVSQSHVCVQQI